MELYGLFGQTHGWAKILTVMSPAGATAALAAVEAGDDVAVQAGAGRLTYYQERRAGGLERLIAAHGIVVLTKTEWDVKKAQLGDAIFR